MKIGRFCGMVGALLRRDVDGKYLVLKRVADKDFSGGAWECITGRVDQEDLPVLYSAADLFVYPAYAEGFGIPPLEAMACGVPVITSDTTSLPEVIGDAGQMVPPDDIRALSRAMERILKDPDLQSNMRAKGLLRAQHFSWTQTAAQILEIYRAVHAESQSQ